MNKTVAFSLLSFVAGALIGALSMKLYIKDKYEKLAQDEIDDVIETFKNRGGKQAQVKVADDLFEDAPRQYVRLATPYSVEQREDLPGEMAGFDNVRDYFDTPRDDPPEEPYVIDVDSYSNEKDDFAKESLFFYEDDDTLSDDNEDIVDDIRAVVGDQALTLLGEDGSDEVVYVRNEKLRVDYEIILLHKSYKVEVMGMPNDEDEG
jgi:hypothetical protein